MAQLSGHTYVPFECRRTMDALDNKPTTRRGPVRLGNFMANPAPASRQSCVNGSLGSTSVRREPMHVERTPQGPRLVHKNPLTTNQNLDPKQSKNCKPLAKTVEKKIPVKRQLQALQNYNDTNFDMNLTLGGIQTLLSPAAMPPEDCAEPTEKKPRSSQLTRARGYNLQKLAIHQAMDKRNQTAIQTAPIPDSPKIILSSKKPLRSIPKQDLPTNQSLLPALGTQIPLESQTANKAAATSAEFKLDQPSSKRTANRKVNANVETVSHPSGNEYFKDFMPRPLALNIIQMTSDHQIGIASACQPTLIDNIKPSECIGNLTSNSVNISILKEKTTSLANIKHFEQQANDLEKEISDNITYQKRCQDELNVVYAKQLDLETEMQRLKFQHNVVYNKRFELETEMQKLGSEHREKQNDFMALCRNVAKLQCNQPSTDIIDTVPSLLPTATDHVDKLLPIMPRNEAGTGKAAETAPLTPVESDQPIEKNLPRSNLRSSLKKSPTATYENNKSENDIESLVTPGTSEQDSTPSAFIPIALPSPAQTKSYPLKEKASDMLHMMKVAVVNIVPLALPVGVQKAPTTPLTPLRRSLRVSSHLIPTADQSSEEVSTAASVTSASKKTLTKPRRRSQSAGNISALATPSTPQNTEVNSKLKEKDALGLPCSSSSKIPVGSKIPDTNDEFDGIVPVALAPSDFYGNRTVIGKETAVLRRSTTFVLDQPASSSEAKKSCDQKSAAKKRRSVIDYRQLQASFHGLLQTPMKTPIGKSAKKQLPRPMDTPSNISRRVQASLELLLDSPTL